MNLIPCVAQPAVSKPGSQIKARRIMSREKRAGEGVSLSPNSVVPSHPETTTVKIPTFSSEQLFGSSKEIGIEHEDLLYRLRITKQGKLILNK